MTCNLCSLVFEETQPRATLMCGHIVHTQCLIIEVLKGNRTCNECFENIITSAIYDIIHPDTSKSYKVLEETSEDFCSDIKILVKNNKDYKKSASKFKKVLSPIVSMYKSQIKSQINLLKNYIKDKLKSIKETEIYKNTVRLQKRFNRLRLGMLMKHNLNYHDFIRYLTKNKIKSDCPINYMLERKFRIRI